MKEYIADECRYNDMVYRRCGKTGLRLPEISLGFWQHFSDANIYNDCRNIVLRAFDLGITHFDLANNYGSPAGSAERNFGRILREDLYCYRDELIITTKAGYDMWLGPYGEWGSRKYLIASIDQSLRRLGLDYVDIFYSHRFDPDTPLEETMGALDQIVKQGKALYVGISNYSPEVAKKAIGILRDLGTPCLVHQPQYSMLNRDPENSLLNVLEEEGVGCVAYQVLSQGLLTDKYLHGIPSDSRIAKGVGALKAEQITPDLIKCIQELNNIAIQRGQTLSQMSIAWLLKDPRVTSVILGASRVEQLESNLIALKNKSFTNEELEKIETILSDYKNNKL